MAASCSLQRVLRPDDRFAELAVAYDIDAPFGLLALQLALLCRRPTASSNFRHPEEGIDVESHQLMFAPVRLGLVFAALSPASTDNCRRGKKW